MYFKILFWLTILFGIAACFYVAQVYHNIQIVDVIDISFESVRYFGS